MMKIGWLRLDTNILDDSKIKMIRKHPAGSDLFVMWIGLMCLAMKAENIGNIYVSEGIPYTDEELGHVLDLETKTIQMGILVFEKYGMISVTSGGIIEVLNFKKHQNIDYIEMKKEENRLKVAKFREKQKLIKQEIVDIDGECVTITEGTVPPHIKGKESKEKKSKVKKRNFLDNVQLTTKEYKTLRSKYTKQEVRWLFDKLSNYKTSSGKDYKNDAAAIRTWVEESLSDFKRKNPFFFLKTNIAHEKTGIVDNMDLINELGANK